MEKTGVLPCSWARPSGGGGAGAGRTRVVGAERLRPSRWVATFWNLTLLLGDGGQVDSLLPQVVHCFEITQDCLGLKGRGT